MSIEAIGPYVTPARTQTSINKNHAIKRFLFLTCFSLVLSVNLGVSAFAGPPTAGIINSYITKQGDGVIYSNGQMQAAVTVHYELSDGLTMSNIELLQHFTEAPVASLGWLQSENDNGYEHEIYSRLRSPKAPDTRSTSDSSTFYMSTQDNGTIEVCYRLTASNESTKTSCDGTENDAFVSLRAMPPVVYSGGDFELREKDRFPGNGRAASLTTLIYGMYSKHQPFNVHSVSGTIEQERIEVDTEISSLMTTDLSNSDGMGVQQGTAYLASDLLAEYSYIDSEDEIRTFDMAMVDNPILKAVQHITFVGMYAGDYLCSALRDSSTTYNCSDYSLGGPVPTVPADAIEAYLIENPSRTIRIVDSYGTEHAVVFRIEKLDFYIED